MLCYVAYGVHFNFFFSSSCLTQFSFRHDIRCSNGNENNIMALMANILCYVIMAMISNLNVFFHAGDE